MPDNRTRWTTMQVAQEAAQLGKPVTQEYIRQLCKNGVLRAEKLGRDWLIPDPVVKQWLENWLKS